MPRVWIMHRKGITDLHSVASFRVIHFKLGGGPENPVGSNRYSYAEGDPVNLFDPTGLQGESPPNDPYEALLSLIRGSLNQWSETTGNPKLQGVANLLNDSTVWGRGWAVEGLSRINKNCGDTLKLKVPGKDWTIGQRLVDVVQNATIVQTWDSAAMNASYGSLFGGNTDQTLRDWLIEQIGTDQGWDGANVGTIVFISGSGASGRQQQMVTLLHELLHQVIPSTLLAGGAPAHIEIAKALGIYQDFSNLGSKVDSLNASSTIDKWLGKCIGEVK